MLVRTIDACDDETWARVVGKRAFWEVAYHALFFTHLYLSPSLEDFEGHPDWAGPFSAGFGRRPEPPFDPVDVGLVLDRLKVRDYALQARDKLVRTLDAETAESLEGPSGFYWLTFTRAEAYLYNLRHIQHHAGQLCALLRAADIPVNWHSSGWDAA